MAENKVQLCILPTATLIEDLYTDLASMSIADYDISELMANAITSLSDTNDMQNRIDQFAGIYSQWGFRRGEATHDGQILANAWVKFVKALVPIFISHGLWDSRGHSNYYYSGFHYHDVMLAQYPD